MSNAVGDLLESKIKAQAAEIERLTAERDLWEARCCAAFWLIPGEVKVGELQDAAKRAAELLRLEQSPRPTEG